MTALQAVPLRQCRASCCTQADNMVSNKEIAAKYSSVEEAEDDFM